MGTPFTLNYASDRVPGRTAANVVKIPLCGDIVPAGLKLIELEIQIAGQRFVESFPPEANLVHSFTWNGKDAFGRTVQGSVPMTVRTGYAYQGVYAIPADMAESFGLPSGVPGTVPARLDVVLNQQRQTMVGNWDARGLGLGGWTLSVHHVYDPTSQTLYLGDGSRRSAAAIGGIIETAAGTGDYGFSGDGGPAVEAQIAAPGGLAVAPDGSIYFSDTDNNRVRRIRNGIVTTVAGTGSFGFNGDGPALTTSLATPMGLDAGLDGSIYIADEGNGRIRRLTPDGQLITVAGSGSGFSGPRGDGGPATEATLLDPWDVAVGPDCALYIADQLDDRIRRVAPDGIISTVAGTEATGFSGDGGPATEARLSGPLGIEATSADELLIADLGNLRVRRVGFDGVITTVAGTGTSGASGDGGPAVQAQLKFPADVQAPLMKSLTANTAGKSYAMTYDHAVTLADPNNPLSLTNLTATMTINGRSHRTVLDATTRTLTQTSPAGRSSVAVYDVLGRIQSSSDPGYPTVSVVRDGRGLLSTVTVGGGAEARTTGYAYNAQGRLEALTDPLQQVRRLLYDAGGRVSRFTSPANNTVQFGYDRCGNTSSIVPPGQPAHNLAYSAINLLAQYLPPASDPGGNTLYSHNLDGQTVSIARPDGLSLAGGYDAAGRLSDLAYPGGHLTYGYDPTTGALTSISSANGITTTHRFIGALLESVTTSGLVSGSVRKTFDNNLRATSLIIKDSHTTVLDYDADGLLIRGGDLVLNRDGNGRLTGTVAQGITDSFTYNPSGEWTGYRALSGGSELYSEEFGPDRLGRTVRRTESVLGQTTLWEYRYDADGRLDQVKKNGQVVSTYGYDSNDNRVTHTSAQGTVTGSYDAQDRLIQYGDVTHRYNANGELISKTQNSQNTTYTTDALGNLLGVSLPDGRQIEYVVDGDGRRTLKRIDGTRVQALLYGTGFEPVAELNSNDGLVSVFVPRGMVRAGTFYRILTDPLGSPRLVVNASTGQVAQRMDYDEFGKVVLDTNPGFQPFGFAGGLYDTDTGLVHFGMREYDAPTGRWTSKDPARFRGGDSNLYSYVGNDPVNGRDPLGLWTDLEGVLSRMAELGPEGQALAQEIQAKQVPVQKEGGSGDLGFTQPPIPPEDIGNLKSEQVFKRFIWLDPKLNDVSAAIVLAHEYDHYKRPKELYDTQIGDLKNTKAELDFELRAYQISFKYAEIALKNQQSDNPNTLLDPRLKHLYDLYKEKPDEFKKLIRKLYDCK